MSETIRPLDASSRSDIRSLLEGAELPGDDIDDPAIVFFGAFDGPTLVGIVGLQTCDGVGLLRSLAVVPEHRARGIAGRLCEHVIVRARDRGMPSLWLLTTTAAGYFTRHAFAVAPRDATPASIRATAQFSSLCPSSAIVMTRAT